MTKQEAIKEFRKLYYDDLPRGDAARHGCAWNAYIAELLRAERITKLQYDTWSNPFARRLL